MAEAARRALSQMFGAPEAESAESGVRVQFRRMLAGLSYADQLKAIAPRPAPEPTEHPVQKKQRGLTRPHGDDAVQKKDGESVQAKADEADAKKKGQADADGDAVQMEADPAVQFEDRNASAGDRATADTRAGANRHDAQVEDKHGSHATDAGMVANNGQSMAENEHFEEDAKDFETALGPAAHSHGTAIAVMAGAAAAVKTYLEELTGTWDARTTKLRDLLKKCGSADPKSSNRVGDAAGAVKKLIDSGTVGERCGMIELFWQKIVLPEFLKAPEDADVAARDAAGEANLNEAMLTGRVQGKTNIWYFYAKQDEATSDHTDPAQAAQQKEAKKALNWQWHTRAPRPTDQQLPPMTVQQTGGVVSAQEMLFQGVTAAGDELQWSNGENAWMLNEYDKWVFAQRELSVPLVAGPSGTTDRIFQALAGMNITDGPAIRTACIGYLLPPRHHSLVEVLTAAAAHGVPFTAGKMMYTDLPPFSAAELKGFGGGKFPHEPRTTT